MRPILIVILLMAPAPIQALAQRTGAVSGSVVDASTLQTLPGASVWLEPGQIGDATGSDGQFSLVNVPAGLYVLHVRFLGFEPAVRPDIVVDPGRTTRLEIKLVPQVLESGEIVVQADYFDRERGEPAGIMTFGTEAVRRGAGTAGDVQRLLAGLPAVSRMDDMRNALAVRGGSPIENRFLVDGIPVPNLNHFPTQGASGGAIGILNPELISEVTFRPAAFGAEHADRLSSVVDLSLREPAPGAFGMQADFGLAGAGVVLESSSETAGVILAARRSWVDLIVKTFLAEQADATPTYSDAVLVGSWRPSPNDRVRLVAMTGIDRSGIDQDAAIENHENQFGDADFDSWMTGLRWIHVNGKGGYRQTVLSRSFSRHRLNFRSTSTGNLFLAEDSRESEWHLSQAWTISLSRTWQLSAGLDGSTPHGRFNTARSTGSSGLKRLKRTRLGVYASMTLRPAAGLQVVPGIRVDRYDEGTLILPRVALRQALGRKLAVRAAAGRYAQQLPLALIAQDGQFSGIRPPEARHAVLGLDWRLSESALVTVDAYLKEYRGFPEDPAFPFDFAIDRLYDDALGMPMWPDFDRLGTDGRARSRGIEASIRKPLARRLYGLASLSLSRSEYRDQTGEWRARLFDNRYVATIDGGYRISDRQQFAVRWTLAGGRPYTPFDLTASQDAGAGVPDAELTRAERLPAYQAINVRYDRRFPLGGSWVVAYASVWNVTGRRNLSGYYWDEVDGRVRERLQWGLLPVIGFEILIR